MSKANFIKMGLITISVLNPVTNESLVKVLDIRIADGKHGFVYTSAVIGREPDEPVFDQDSIEECVAIEVESMLNNLGFGARKDCVHLDDGKLCPSTKEGWLNCHGCGDYDNHPRNEPIGMTTI
jgi:hypothetical protein